jgi:hypothetical protein
MNLVYVLRVDPWYEFKTLLSINPLKTGQYRDDSR